MTTEYVIQDCGKRHTFDDPIECPFCEIERLRSRLAEAKDKLSIALAANHDLRDERDSLKDRLADPCKTYDKDGRLLTVCHKLAEAEARLNRYEEALRRIASLDYRGNRHESSYIAASAIATGEYSTRGGGR